MHRTQRSQWLMLTFALLALLVGAVPVKAANPVPPVTPQSPVPLGSSLPPFAVMARDGAIFTRADLAPHRPTLVIFTNTWGPICQAEAKVIAKVAPLHPQVQVVLIGTPDHQTPDDVFAFASRFAMPFPSYYDGYSGPLAPDAEIRGPVLGQNEAAWKITGYPALIVADENGTVRAGRQGYLSEEDLNAVLSNVDTAGA